MTIYFLALFWECGFFLRPRAPTILDSPPCRQILVRRGPDAIPDARDLGPRHIG
jgi:hypothetical protein